MLHHCLHERIILSWFYDMFDKYFQHHVQDKLSIEETVQKLIINHHVETEPLFQVSGKT